MATNGNTPLSDQELDRQRAEAVGGAHRVFRNVRAPDHVAGGQSWVVLQPKGARASRCVSRSRRRPAAGATAS